MCTKWNPEYLRSFFFCDSPKLHAHYSPLNSHLLLGIRIIGALYLTGYYIFDILQSQTLLVRFIYLTNVGYFLTWLYFITILQSSFIKCASGLENYCEILFQTALCAQVYITIIYWPALYTQTEVSSLNVPIFYDINWHGVPISILFLDFIFCSYRFIPSQFCSFLVFTFVYMILINMSYSIGVRPVYGRATDWVGWIIYALIVVGIIFAGIIYVIGRVIFKKCKQANIDANNQLITSEKYQKPKKKKGINSTNNLHIDLG